METLRILKKGDAVSKAELFFNMVDFNGNGFISLDEILGIVKVPT